MNCRDAEIQILAERDGALPEEQLTALTNHLAECAACRQLRADLAAGFEGWRTQMQAVRVPDPEREWHRVKREIQDSGRATNARRAITWLGVPLAAAAAVALGLYVASPDNQTGDTPVRQVAVQSATPANAAASTVIFVDDSSGWTFVLGPDALSASQHI